MSVLPLVFTIKNPVQNNNKYRIRGIYCAELTKNGIDPFSPTANVCVSNGGLYPK
ncbi:hypothetical protein VCO01S_14530 [Vibrio comitans NBRC 102076]|uniref:Uncharacterized protein n=1 Tax=Vibrio comitans NBRC 102076 TaxID=1219078 RepID=A0A4Y3INF8_9VIBR|nr:hypothetical protein VCO01S_14530 [Vibrio comitans NBRC 102076]